MIIRMTRHTGETLSVTFAKDAAEEFTAREMTGFERHFDRSFLDLARPRMEWLGFFAWQRLRVEMPGAMPAKFEAFWDTVDMCVIDGDEETSEDSGEGLDPTAPAAPSDLAPSPA